MGARRSEFALFWVLFLTYACFHQGGGWNQNARFAQARALAESGSWSIERFAYYGAAEGGGAPRLRRLAPPPTLRLGRGEPVPSSLDVAVRGNRMYPNKPPGTTLLALPAQLAFSRLARALGADPDDWWTLALDLYAVTLFSVGLAAALGGVLFARVSRRLFPRTAEVHHQAAALALFLGTLLLPYATVLFSHVPEAVALLAGFALLLRHRDGAGGPGALALAGFAAGCAVLASYAAVVGVACLGVYALSVARPRVGILAFAGGGLVPAAALAGYQAACFGDPLALANDFQLAKFSDPAGRLWLGMLGAPDPRVALRVLVSPRFGLFPTSPLLVLSALGAALAWRAGERRRELLLAGALFASTLAVNASFNGWSGGASYGARYLMVPLLFGSLALALAFERWPRSAGAVAAFSVASLLFVTAVSPQVKRSIPDLLRERIAGEPGARVSSWAVGAYEARPYQVFPRGSGPARWNAFLTGELVAPPPLALAPLLLVLGGGAALLAARARGRIR